MEEKPRRSPRNHPGSTAATSGVRRKQTATTKSGARPARSSTSKQSKAAIVAASKHIASAESSSAQSQRPPLTHTAIEVSPEPTTNMKKRQAPANDLDPFHQCLVTPPVFKRICLTHGEYRAPLEDGIHYNDASHAAITIRQLADQAWARNLRQDFTRLTEDHKRLVNQRATEDHEQQILLESKLDRASLHRQVLELQADKQRIEDESRREVEQFRAEKNELERSKNAVIADLESTRDDLKICSGNQTAQIADLLRELQMEREARMRAELERDATLTKTNEPATQSNNPSPDFARNDQTVEPITEHQPVHTPSTVEESQADLEENSCAPSNTDQDQLQLKAKHFTLKTVHERWRGETIPPKVTPRGQINPPAVRQEEPELTQSDLRMIRNTPNMFLQMVDERRRQKERRAQRQARNVSANEEGRSIFDEANKHREQRHEEYVTAQQDFEEGRHDRIPIGKVLHDFREENWVSFSKAPDGSVRRNGVYAVQSEKENSSVHILPYPEAEHVGLRARALYAIDCLTAQHPELQAEAAKKFLSKEEYIKFMERSFGSDWRSLEMSDGGIEPEAWQRTVKNLRRSNRFRTACRLWAAGEPALNEHRCWPPTFESMEKTQACTHFNDDDERLKVMMSCLPGRPRETVKPYYIDEASEEQADAGHDVDGASRVGQL
ncbi:hypothetical protein PRZ48_012563 [Zasmidium cellare]|uniref:Uncharacterized protein n=1 Tax=Zasmidium cellare TaxID=395010 RepID=A0ABR0E5N4_ZASCE|nr:hypothetical protein PRZ48_012563 [Zasmidium cellare]